MTDIAPSVSGAQPGNAFDDTAFDGAVPDNARAHDARSDKPLADDALVDNEDTVVIWRPCAFCGAPVDVSGYCQACGAEALKDRNHYTEHPATWAAACCDRGVRHHRNEDASAIAAEADPGARAVLVVCDGVSTSTASDVASLRAARAARDLLATRPPGRPTRTESWVRSGADLVGSRSDDLTTAIREAVRVANDAVRSATTPGSPSAASCTFAAAVLERHLLVYGNVGDSRIYWLPDAGSDAPRLLSLDDSLAQLRIDAGSPRADAETGPQAHAITKWLGRDSPDISPTTGWTELVGPGWVLVCSDGLWNYASEPVTLQELVAERSSRVRGDPLALVEALVSWACEQGGKDNVTVALARHEAP